MVRHDDAKKLALSAARAESQALYQALAAPFPEEAIERTNGRQTGRGYDTTGIKYQYVVNRLNEVLGLGGYRAQREITVKQTATSKGRPGYEAICDITLQLGEWVDGTFTVFAEALADGGHFSVSEADARKGAYTNAFKKAAAFFGVGKQAYEGSIDDDNVTQDGEEASPFTAPPQATERRRVPKAQPAQAEPIQAQSEMTQAEKARAMATAARDKQIFDEAIATGLSRDGFHAWAERIIGRPYSSNGDWTEDDRCHLEDELLARGAKVAQMAKRENLQNSPTLSRNGSGRPVPAE
ncbi:MAG: hypothetical protein JXA90_09070 [Planctomycetes bacterium]|nr:hypothetical protein [Planctomycetota bacterium]